MHPLCSINIIFDHIIRIKKNVGADVQLNTYVNNKPHCSNLHKNEWVKRQGVTSNCPPIDQLRIDNWPEAPGTASKNAISVSSPYLD